MKEITIDTPLMLCSVADAIIESLDGRTVVLLHGPMGSGKTTLLREIAANLGSTDTVTSPTFAIVNEYVVKSGDVIYHFDMYRIESTQEAQNMGFSEYIDSGRLCFIEWAERVEQLLPDDAMLVRIEILGDTKRKFTID
ncbi:MAG: tRNA (adenosine(37)-N6)-threonylcarbamoyltransferase complex ATPase subunit type 1 TsaE [Rikenellaceae bacterium]